MASGRQPLLLSVWLPRVEAAPPWLGWRGARRLVGWVGPLAARPASPPGRWESSLYHPWSPQASSILTGSSCCLCLWRPLISVPPNGNEAAPSPPCPVSSPASHLPILSSPRGFRPRWAAGLPTPTEPSANPPDPMVESHRAPFPGVWPEQLLGGVGAAPECRGESFPSAWRRNS